MYDRGLRQIKPNGASRYLSEASKKNLELIVVTVPHPRVDGWLQ